MWKLDLDQHAMAVKDICVIFGHLSENYSTQQGGEIANSHSNRPPTIFFRSNQTECTGAQLTVLVYSYVRGNLVPLQSILSMDYGAREIESFKSFTRRNIMRATNHHALQKQCKF